MQAFYSAGCTVVFVLAMAFVQGCEDTQDAVAKTPSEVQTAEIGDRGSSG